MRPYAFLEGQYDIVNVLLANGANANAEAGNNRTPLACAVLGNHGEIVKIILRNAGDVDINTQFGTGGTLLHLAVQEGRYAIADILLSNGANVNAKTINSSETALH